MIVIGRLLFYGVEGKKIAELKSYLHQNVEYRYVGDLKGFAQIKRAIRNKVKELNTKYRQTVPIEFEGKVDEKYNSGALTFRRPGASSYVLRLDVLCVKEYWEGGES